MSTYAEFYFRTNEHDFISIKSISRNSTTYPIFSSKLEWEKPIWIGIETINSWRDLFNEEIDSKELEIKHYNEKIERVKGFNNSIEEKLDLLDEYDGVIEDLHDEILNLHNGIYFCDLMRDYICSNKWEDSAVVDWAHCIAAGIECARPSVDEQGQLFVPDNN